MYIQIFYLIGIQQFRPNLEIYVKNTGNSCNIVEFIVKYYYCVDWVNDASLDIWVENGEYEIQNIEPFK